MPYDNRLDLLYWLQRCPGIHAPQVENTRSTVSSHILAANSGILANSGRIQGDLTGPLTCGAVSQCTGPFPAPLLTRRKGRAIRIVLTHCAALAGDELLWRKPVMDHILGKVNVLWESKVLPQSPN